MDLAKSKLREDILQKKKNELLMADRDPLHLTDKSDKENDEAAENGEEENSDLTVGNTGRHVLIFLYLLFISSRVSKNHVFTFCSWKIRIFFYKIFKSYIFSYEIH